MFFFLIFWFPWFLILFLYDSIDSQNSDLNRKQTYITIFIYKKSVYLYCFLIFSFLIDYFTIILASIDLFPLLILSNTKNRKSNSIYSGLKSFLSFFGDLKKGFFRSYIIIIIIIFSPVKFCINQFNFITSFFLMFYWKTKT